MCVESLLVISSSHHLIHIIIIHHSSSLWRKVVLEGRPRGWAREKDSGRGHRGCFIPSLRTSLVSVRFNWAFGNLNVRKWRKCEKDNEFSGSCDMLKPVQFPWYSNIEVDNSSIGSEGRYLRVHIQCPNMSKLSPNILEKSPNISKVFQTGPLPQSEFLDSRFCGRSLAPPTERKPGAASCKL